MPSYLDFLIAAEAVVLAAPVEIGLRCLSLDVLVARLGRTPRHPARSRSLDVERAARVIERAAGFYPFRATCLKKSLILLRILRRRGILAELRLGVRKVQDEFHSHAWIECEGHVLLGGGVEHLYAALPLGPAFTHVACEDVGNEGSDVRR